jgi:hypothetical protein
MEYLFRQKDEWEGDPSTVFVKFEAVSLMDITVKFREFLLGCGYSVKNVNEYVPDPYADPYGSDDPPDSEGGEE